MTLFAGWILTLRDQSSAVADSGGVPLVLRVMRVREPSAGGEHRATIDAVYRAIFPTWFLYTVLSLPFFAYYIISGPELHPHLGTWFWITVWANYVVVAATVWFIATDRRLPRDQQLLWAVAAGITGCLAAFIYWWKYMRATQKQ